MLSASGALLTGVLNNNVWTAHGGASIPYSLGAGAYTTGVSVAGNKEYAACR